MHLTAQGRRRSRRRGKNHEGDALIIARVAIQEPNLARMDAAHLNTDLKLLVDARDQLVPEQIRVRNRLHALLLGLSPGYRAVTGALTSKAALQRAHALVVKERNADPVRTRLASPRSTISAHWTSRSGLFRAYGLEPNGIVTTPTRAGRLRRP